MRLTSPTDSPYPECMASSIPTSDAETIRHNLGRWYLKNRRDLPWRNTSDPYAIWVSEVMLQQTQVQTVIPYYLRFLQRFPSVTRLAQADMEDVLKIWEGLGYYARARNLYKAAQEVVSHYDGIIPPDAKEFRELPGVGEYICAAVSSIAFNQPLAVVDGNVKRVLARMFQLDISTNSSKAHPVFQETAEAILDQEAPGDFNQAMMELGATICTPKTPDCKACPVVTQCQSYGHQTVSTYPKRNPSKSVPEVALAVGVIIHEGKMLITRRKPEGLLGGLWEFPGGKMAKGESAEATCVREIKEETGLDVTIRSHLTQVKHAYSHFRIVMDVFICDYTEGEIRLNGPIDYRWAGLGELDRYPFPKANLKFMPLLKHMVMG